MIDKQGIVHQIANVIENVTYHTYGYDIVGGGYFNDNTEGVRLWTIQDAKDGDVLCDYCKELPNPLIFILKKFEHVDFGLAKKSDYSSYCFLKAGKEQEFQNGSYHHKHNIFPATKEQHELLFSKMKEAGYEWNSEKKELNKIKQKLVQEIEPFEAVHGKYYYCIKDYFCGGKKQASKGDVVQALRGLPIIGLKDASEYFLPVNFIKCNSAWSEDDKRKMDRIYSILRQAADTHAFSTTCRLIGDKECVELQDFLKALKERVLPRSKQEWSKRDLHIFNNIYDFVKENTIDPNRMKCAEECIDWLIKNLIK